MDEKHRCYRCEFCRPHFDQYGWGFYGCHGGDYHGKPIGEINDCPDGGHGLIGEKIWNERKQWSLVKEDSHE